MKKAGIAAGIVLAATILESSIRRWRRQHTYAKEETNKLEGGRNERY